MVGNAKNSGEKIWGLKRVLKEERSSVRSQDALCAENVVRRWGLS